MSQKDKEKLSAQSKVGKAKEETPIPNGELKWSINEESSANTETNLKSKEKEEKTPNTEKAEKKEKKNNKQAKNKAKKKANEKAREKKKLAQKNNHAPEPEEQGQEISSTVANVAVAEKKNEQDEKPADKQTQNLEDTMGPIDFKEYSLRPEKDQNKPEKQEPEKDKITPAEKSNSKPFVFKPEEKTKDSKVKKAQTSRKKHTRDSVKAGQAKLKIPKWKWALKTLWLPISLLLSLFIGLLIGHTVIGEQPAGQIFNIDMWTHLYKLIFTK